MNGIDLVLLILASFRLTHLLVFDGIAEPLRRPLLDKPFIGDLVQCHWCLGVWVSAFLVLLYYLWPTVSQPLNLVLAVAAGQAFLESLRGE